MKRRYALLLVLTVLVAVPVGFLYLVDRHLRAGVGPDHTFQLPYRAAFLTEELALVKARDALDRDGLGAAAWTPVGDRRSTAPDGRPDEFMARNQTNPNRGVFRFRRGPRETRFVSVELHGDRVVCQTYRGK